MNQIITYLPVLAIVMAINIALGMYYQIGKQNFKFDKAKFINGIIKAAILGLSAVGLAYCFDVVDLTSVGITPLLVIQTAIITYAGKDLINFGKILGITLDNKSYTVTSGYASSEPVTCTFETTSTEAFHLEEKESENKE